MDFTIFGMTPWFVFAAVAAFAGMISYFQVNSAWSDKIGQPKGNRIFIGVGVAFTILFIWFMYMAAKTSTGTGG